MTDKKEGMIHEAMAGIMADIGAIGKDRENVSQSYKFRGIDDVYNALHPIMVAHKVFVVPEVMEVRREEKTAKSGAKLGFVTVQMNYHFTHADGTSVSVLMAGEGMDSGDKATAKALSGALKYALFQTFMIPTDEAKDFEEDHYEIADPEKAAALPGGIIEDAREEPDPMEVNARELAEKIYEGGTRKYSPTQINKAITTARTQGRMQALIDVFTVEQAEKEPEEQESML